ncbi:MAG: hypothetical protein MJ240_08945 [Kiritimatiellae bacterium]|nr:hypothetical protein [Kiritimatiellia bacterium]
MKIKFITTVDFSTLSVTVKRVTDPARDPNGRFADTGRGRSRLDDAIRALRKASALELNVYR